MSTAIEWTDETWNPTRGCSRVSPGCMNCYAETVANRFSGPGKAYHGLVNASGRWNGELRFVETALDAPLRWRAPRRIFVNSMSDLFHEKVADEWIDRIFAVMGEAGRHTFQILTKRPERMRDYMTRRMAASSLACIEDDLPNVHVGVSVEHQAAADERIPLLLQTPAAVRFLSVEPLLGPVYLPGLRPEMAPGFCVTIDGELWHKPGGCKLCRPGLDWIIVGGESGPGARPCDLAWIRSVVQQAEAAGVPCFVKQLGAAPYTICSACYSDHPGQCRMFGRDGHGHDRHRPLHLRDRKGGDPAEWPEDLRVRDFPR